MVTLINTTANNLGPYSGLSLPANGSVTLTGAIAPYISDGTLLSDILSEKINVTFAGNQVSSAYAAALLMQLGQLFNTDSDGANLSRVKQAPSGWTYQLRGFEFTTSTLSSLFNKDAWNNTLSDIVMSFYDSNGTLLTDQTSITSSCVKTVVDFEPTYDYYLIGGKANPLQVPTNDTRISVIAVPDYPAVAGGSKVMIQNINVKYLAAGDKVEADGRASKGLLYNNPVPHTNKIRFVIYHAVGDVVSFCIALEMYKQ